MNRATSIYLDLVRLLAAVAVLLTHLAYPQLSGGWLLPLRTYGNDAVMIFFVLSGYVIAYTAATRDLDVRDYLLNRCARLYSVAIPAILVTIVLDQAGRALNPDAYAGFWYKSEQPVLRVLTALTFTNELWFNSWRLFTNGPSWSLGYEFWYYGLFAAGWYFDGWRRWALFAAGCLLVGPKVLLLFPVWLLGVWVYRVNRRGNVSPSTGTLLFFGSMLAYIAFRTSGMREVLLEWSYAELGRNFVIHSLAWSNEFLSSYLLGLLVAFNFIGCQAISGFLTPGLERIAPFVRDWAGYTFSIYLFHYPLLRFLGATGLFDPASPLAITALFTLTLLGCRVLANYSEKRKDAARALLEKLTGHHRAARPLASTSLPGASQP